MVMILPTDPLVIHIKTCFFHIFLLLFYLYLSICYKGFAENYRVNILQKKMLFSGATCVYFVDNLWACIRQNSTALSCLVYSKKSGNSELVFKLIF